ncbi:MAG: hypothetical protein ACR2N3_17025 [Pyrinomonadaceae bacterium]
MEKNFISEKCQEIFMFKRIFGWVSFLFGIFSILGGVLATLGGASFFALLRLLSIGVLLMSLGWRMRKAQDG